MMEDGVIKYQIDFKQTEIPSVPHWSSIENVRSRLFQLGLIGVDKEGVGYGNISQRINSTQFVITGTQTGHLSQLYQKDYTIVLEYDFDQFYLKAKGQRKPSSEALTHAALYLLSDEVQVVIHIHAAKLWHYMLKTNYARVDAAYGTRQIIEEVQSLYAERAIWTSPTFVMAAHYGGIITMGKNLQDAECAVYTLLKDFLMA